MQVSNFDTINLNSQISSLSENVSSAFCYYGRVILESLSHYDQMTCFPSLIVWPQSFVFNDIILKIEVKHGNFPLYNVKYYNYLQFLIFLYRKSLS